MPVTSLKMFDVFGRLTLLNKIFLTVGKDKRIQSSWYCICECGKTTYGRTSSIKSGSKSSCGCLKAEHIKNVAYRSPIKYSLEEKNSPIFKRWRGIFSRCQIGPKNKNYKIYKGKGIKVCQEWHDYYVFKKWAESSGFSKSLTIDRIDSNLGYFPENCRWVTMKENLENRYKKTT